MPATLPSSVSLSSVDDLSSLVRDCAASKTPIVDYGVLHTGVGHAPPRERVKLSLTGGVVEHYERDLTVRVHAGMKLGDLRAALAPTNQFVPIDADDALSVGEVINHNVYGGLRCGYGSIRDLLLGLHYIDAQGRDIHVGGRTVKNVAGYDVTRLMVGSLGTLGIVHEATLRTYAVPETVLLVPCRLKNPAELDRVLTAWVTSDAAPTWLRIETNFSTSGKSELLLVCGYLGRAAATAAQARALENFAKSTGAFTAEAPAIRAADEFLRRVGREFPRGLPALMKIVVPPSAAGSLCRTLEQTGLRLNIHAFPVHGCVFAGGELDETQARELDRAVTQAIAPAGFRTWYYRPAGCDDLAPFAPMPSDFAVMKRLKKMMDPMNLFNPGRLFPTEGAAQ